MLAMKTVPMTKPCKNGHMSEWRVDNKACVQCSRERARKQHQDIRANVVKWEEFQQRMRECRAKSDDDDWHKKPAEVGLDKVSRRFRDCQREVYGISRKQAADDLRLLRTVRRGMAK